MGTRVRVMTAAALIGMSLLTGCTRTTTGTVAQTTEAGGPLLDAQTITCKEYAGLDEQGQLAIVGDLVGKDDNPLGSQGARVAKSLADAICQYLPDARLSEILVGR
jgi:hypothetical protein